jgi:AraC family transcriptional regulator, regulatory protein of adaptative response / methylated-DNA-[protein]-cysteine methyltransferase
MKAPGERSGGGAAHTTLLRFGFLRCSLGLALVAVRQEGLAAVLFGEQRGELEVELARRFPNCPIEAAEVSLAPLLQTLAECLEQPSLPLPLPLAPLGTLFQRSVWQALTHIPAGQTISYGALAELLGNPRAVRAVAAACGANPLAVLVPCHRVVGRDGSLTGYRWGLERKRALLERESEPALPFEPCADP